MNANSSDRSSQPAEPAIPLSTPPTPEAEPVQQDTLTEARLLEIMGEWDFVIPTGAFDEIIALATPPAEKQAAPSGEDWPVPYGKLLTMLRWARRYVADERLHESELDGRKRHETIQEHEDRISSAIQANEDTRTFLQEIDEALALIDATPAPQDTKGADNHG